MNDHTTPRDLDWSNVHDDASQDPTLDRPCEEGIDCRDARCPLVHPVPSACWCGEPATYLVPVDPQVSNPNARMADAQPGMGVCEEHMDRDGYEPITPAVVTVHHPSCPARRDPEAPCRGCGSGVPPAERYHHQSFPGGAVRCRICQGWVTDWVTHDTTHAAEPTTKPDRDAIQSATALATALLRVALVEDRADLPAALATAYDEAIQEGDDDLAEVLSSMWLDARTLDLTDVALVAIREARQVLALDPVLALEQDDDTP